MFMYMFSKIHVIIGSMEEFSFAVVANSLKTQNGVGKRQKKLMRFTADALLVTTMNNVVASKCLLRNHDFQYILHTYTLHIHYTYTHIHIACFSKLIAMYERSNWNNELYPWLPQQVYKVCIK